MQVGLVVSRSVVEDGGGWVTFSGEVNTFRVKIAGSRWHVRYR